MYVNHNAKCPVCGAPVYYYQNEHGSRVFFDALGDDWPKHPCTDNPREPVRFSSPFPIVDKSLFTLGMGADNPFVRAAVRLGISATHAEIRYRKKHGKEVLLILEVLDVTGQRYVYAACRKLPKCCRVGYVIELLRRKVRFYNPATEDLESVAIKRLRPSAFLAKLRKSGGK